MKNDGTMEGCPILQQIYAWHCIVLTSDNNNVQKHNNREWSKTRNLTMLCINLLEYWTSVELVSKPNRLYQKFIWEHFDVHWAWCFHCNEVFQQACLPMHIQYCLKVWVHKNAVKPRQPPFCFPRIYCGGTKTATAERTKATEDNSSKDTVMPQ